MQANYWPHLWEIPPIIAVKGNTTTLKYVRRIIVNMFCWGRIRFTGFEHPNIDGARLHIQSTTSLDDGRCEATIIVIKWSVMYQWG